MSARPLAGAFAALALAALAALALAQAADVTPRAGRLPPARPGDPGRTVPFVIMDQAPGPGAAGARRTPPLPPAFARRIRHAMDLRLAGRTAEALDTLRAVQRDLPHHPIVVTELARTHLAREEWSAAASLLRAERASARDSLLGSAELELSAERLGRPREAAQVVAETWTAAPGEGQWALTALLRLLPQEPRGTTQAMREAAARNPGRGDLARGLALLLSRQGRADEAADVLARADRPGWRLPLRRTFADEVLFSGLSADTAAAIEALVSLAADTAFAPVLRVGAATRAFEVARPGPRGDATAPRLADALEDVPPSAWGQDLLLGLSRTLREAGRGREAVDMLSRGGTLLRTSPELALERAWAQLREGPPEAALPALDSLAQTWPHARFALAEAEFWAGRMDSALANHKRVARQPGSDDAVASLDRVYLLEQHPGDPALPVLGRLAYERWRGDDARARRLADSLWHALPLDSPYSADAALELAELRAGAKDWTGALEPLMVVADSLPGDRLAPVARQRAGEALLQMGESQRALAQFEECLARYPRAWNAAEVRRRVERLRRESRL